MSRRPRRRFSSPFRSQSRSSSVDSRGRRGRYICTRSRSRPGYRDSLRQRKVEGEGAIIYKDPSFKDWQLKACPVGERLDSAKARLSQAQAEADKSKAKAEVKENAAKRAKIQHGKACNQVALAVADVTALEEGLAQSSSTLFASSATKVFDAEKLSCEFKQACFQDLLGEGTICFRVDKISLCEREDSNQPFKEVASLLLTEPPHSLQAGWFSRCVRRKRE